MTINYTFAPSSNAALFDINMPATFFQIHTYILSRLQIPNWKINKTDICNRLGLSMSTVKRAFRWLRDHGYAQYDKSTQWQFYPCPIDATNAGITATSAQDGFIFDPPKEVIFDPPYIEVLLPKKEKQQPAPTPPIIAVTEDVVVVLSANEQTVPLIFPETLDKDQKKAIKAIIKQLNEPAMTQELLFTLGYAIASGHIKSSLPGYFRRLVDAANNGTFTPVGAHTATKTPTAADRVEETRKRLDEAKNLKVDNAGFFADMAKRYGSKAAAAIPV